MKKKPIIVLASGLLFVLTSVFVFSDEKEEPETRKPVVEKTAVETEPVGFDELSLELYRKNKLFDKKSYADLRKAYAYDFDRQYEKNLDFAWGKKSESFRKFMDENTAIRDTFFLAINPGDGGDNVPTALYLMKEIWEKYPETFKNYPSLAIAVSLVWDNPGRAIHSGPVGQHKAVDPPEQAEALANFYYYSHAEKAMGDRIRYMPWEFLALLVDHKTPLKERQWALTNYLPKRTNIGKIYGEVPYDFKMLDGKADPKLSTREMSLPNMLQYGGVCSCQADFATRVGKSVGAPAFYATGRNQYGGLHAWVMWIEIDDISSRGMRCSMKSEGRYFGDNYYIGSTREPWSGKGTTDRALAVKLYSIGVDTPGYRQSVLALRAFDRIAAVESLTTRQKLDYLGKVVELNPYSMDAWRRMAGMVREGLFDKKDASILKKHFGTMMKTFAMHPDFIWEVFDDFISFEGWQKLRGENYGKLCSLYETANRPDLVCKARLKFAGELAAEGKVAEALKGLAATCLKYPKEGTILPEVLNEMDRLCQSEPEKTEANYRSLASFYKAFMPKVPKKRGGSPSDFCVNVYERGIRVFEQVGDAKAVSIGQTELQQLKAGTSK